MRNLSRSNSKCQSPKSSMSGSMRISTSNSFSGLRQSQFWSNHMNHTLSFPNIKKLNSKFFTIGSNFFYLDFSLLVRVIGSIFFGRNRMINRRKISFWELYFQPFISDHIKRLRTCNFMQELCINKKNIWCSFFTFDHMCIPNFVDNIFCHN